jgi:hypothetical protein
MNKGTSGNTNLFKNATVRVFPLATALPLDKAPPVVHAPVLSERAKIYKMTPV